MPTTIVAIGRNLVLCQLLRTPLLSTHLRHYSAHSAANDADGGIVTGGISADVASEGGDGDSSRSLYSLLVGWSSQLCLDL